MELSEAYLKSILHYNPDVGAFTWRQRPRDMFSCDRLHASFNTRFSGKTAGSLAVRGNIDIRVGNVLHKAHRLAWLYTTGSWPMGEIDHISGDQTDNRFVNLRDVSSSRNSRNMKKKTGSLSAISGVTWSVNSRMWRARIQASNNIMELGYFNSLLDAASARISMQNRLGFSTRHGRPLYGN